MEQLIGIGIYTAAEAGRLLRIAPAKIARWLKGHQIANRRYEPLWSPQISIDEGPLVLGFRDLMETRVVASFIRLGIPPHRIRETIRLAREVVGDERPLSTDRFRTDGREIFFRVLEVDQDGRERERLLNLFRRQFEFKQIIDPLLKSIDFDDRGAPSQWWPLGKRGHIVLDPARAFGQPLDDATSVPTAVLAKFGRHHGIEQTAASYDVPAASVRRAMEFEEAMGQ